MGRAYGHAHNFMNRRDLLKRIVTGAPAMALSIPALASIDLSSPSLSTPYDFMFNGWRCMWGGWREMPNMDVRVGIWTAYGAKTDTWHLYSAWPGMVGSFVRGSVLNIQLQKDQVMPDIGCSEDDLKWFRNECLERLKRAIVKVGPPPLDREKLL